MTKIDIYTDGACLGNPGPGGIGIVLLYNELEKKLSYGFLDTTNNRMEMLAIIVALKSLKKPCNIDLYSDSRYVIDALTKGWVLKWQANNWMRNNKDPALNVDLWEIMLDVMKGHRVNFIWVKGHSGNKYNEICDKLAQSAAEKGDFTLSDIEFAMAYK